MSHPHTLGSELSLLEMSTPVALPSEAPPAPMLKPRHNFEQARKRFDHLIHVSAAPLAAFLIRLDYAPPFAPRSGAEHGLHSKTLR